ncbi:MAG: ferrous iron transport protein A [Clostridiales bacterium]|mgnify:FL=1|nr:ferrous iron transport protein A [Clostridiales bacterium]
MAAKTLAQLRPGQNGVVKNLSGEGAIKRRMIDMGITPGVRITVRKSAPLGDPIEVNVRGYELTLRKREAKLVELEDEHGI